MRDKRFIAWVGPLREEQHTPIKLMFAKKIVGPEGLEPSTR